MRTSVLLATILLLSMSGAAMAATTAVSVTNGMTNLDIWALWIAESGQNNWQAVQLNNTWDGLQHGQSVTMHLPLDNQCLYDLKAGMSNAGFDYNYSVDFCKSHDYTFQLQ